MSTVHSFQALGTHWHIELLEADVDTVAILSATQAFLEQFEQRYSRFRTDSWLSQLNQERVFADPDPEFVALLQKSLSYTTATNGVFTIAIGERMERSGYDQAYSFVADNTNDKPVPPLARILSITEKEIRLPSGQLDFGGIGKGYVIDLLAAMYQERFGLRYFIINGGGDMFVTSDDGRPVTISLAHPQKQSQSIGTVSLRNQGFAASSPYVRAWTDKKTGIQHNHLQTTNEIASYVVAASCCDADVFATASAIDPTVVDATVEILLVQAGQVVKTTPAFSLHHS